MNNTGSITYSTDYTIDNKGLTIDKIYSRIVAKVSFTDNTRSTTQIKGFEIGGNKQNRLNAILLYTLIAIAQQKGGEERYLSFCGISCCWVKVYMSAYCDF
jgi:hypothetical protein